MLLSSVRYMPMEFSVGTGSEEERQEETARKLYQRSAAVRFSGSA
jgi:hypothetical protein